MCCLSDATWCHPSACDGEEPLHVIRCGRCADRMNWRTLGYKLQSTIPTGDVAPVDLRPVSRGLVLPGDEVQLGLGITRWRDVLYQPILAQNALR